MATEIPTWAEGLAPGRWWQFGLTLVSGCTRVSPACDNCWSLAMEKRFGRDGPVMFHPERLAKLRRRKPSCFAIWNDLFHPKVLDSDLHKVWNWMALCQRHTFIALTKRPERARQYITNNCLAMYKCLWLGTTVEDQQRADERIPKLLEIPAAVRFVSVEPLLKTPQLPPYIEKLDWVIVGAESGSRRRPCNTEAVYGIVRLCCIFNTPVFVKQLHHKGKVIKPGHPNWPNWAVQQWPKGKEANYE